MFLCELCNKEHDGTYGSGIFCCAKCARSFSTHNKREEINKKVSNTLKQRYSNEHPNKQLKKIYRINLTKKYVKFDIKYVPALRGDELYKTASKLGINLDTICVIPGFSKYFASTDGIIYDGLLNKVVPFNSNGYQQVKIRSDDNVSRVKGVHQLVAATFLPDYTLNCVVHHIDENRHNNKLSNLKVMSSSDHARFHANPIHLLNYTKLHGSWNKGKTMTAEFRQHCREAALRRKSYDK